MNYSPFPIKRRAIHRVSVLGRHDYAEIIATYHREPKSHLLTRVFETFHEDFEMASITFGPKEWIYLAWQRPCSIHALTDPAFDPRHSLAERSRKPLDFVPDGLAADEVECFRQTTPEALRTIDPDVSKAAWCVLSVVRQLCRTNDVIEDERWWEPEWIADHLPESSIWVVRPNTGTENSAVSGPDLDVPI